VLHFDEYLTSDKEVRCRCPFEICIVLIAFLSLRHVFPKETMEFIKVYSKISGMGR